MKLIDLYNTAIEAGMENDLRTKEQIEQYLQTYKEKFKSLKDEEKEFFDPLLAQHPFADSRILNGDGQTDVQAILIGIDISSAEVILADRLREKGRRVDAIMSHHPSARAWAQFYEVMDMQADILGRLGANSVSAQNLMAKRQGEVKRKVMPANHFQALDAAKLLGLPWLCIHTPADNCVVRFLTNLFEEKRPKKLKEVIDILMDIEEYKEGARRGCGPVILCGDKNGRAGKVSIDMTGGTEGPVDFFDMAQKAGVGTIIGMHFSEAHFKKAKEVGINLVIAGHIPSDTLGMNLMLDYVEKKHGRIETIDCSGFYRIIRNG